MGSIWVLVFFGKICRSAVIRSTTTGWSGGRLSFPASIPYPKAFSEACRRAGLVLLEPIMSIEVVCPEEFVGGVLKDLRMRGAEVHEVTVRDGLRVITGKVPLARMFEYASQLRSLTRGRGTASLEPSEYGEVSRQDYARLVGD